MDLPKLKALEEDVRKAQQALEDKRREVATQIGLHALELGAADLPTDVLTGAILHAVQAVKTGGAEAAALTKRGAEFRDKSRKPGRPRQTSGGSPAGAGSVAPSAGTPGAAAPSETPSDVAGQ